MLQSSSKKSLKPSIYKAWIEKPAKERKNVLIAERNVFVCVDGVPTSLQRHRSCILNGRVHSYDSQKKLKKTVLESILMQLPPTFEPFQCPVEMLVEFYMPIPNSFSKRKQRSLIDYPHDKKPDLSNLIKFFEDAFNGVLYRDDSLISKIHASKVHSLEPKTLICVREYIPEESYIEEVKSYIEEYKQLQNNLEK